MAGISSKALNGGVENKRKFNSGSELQSGEFSDGTGLEWYDVQARFYDQQIGRFIQIDPLPDDEDQESLNSFHYSFNNPVRFNDPDGKVPIETIWDVGNLIWDVGKAVVKHVQGDHKAAQAAWVDAGADLAATLIPYVPAGATKLIKVADKASDAIRAVDKAGDAGKALSKAEQLAKNKAAGQAGEATIKKQLQSELKKGETLLEQPSFKLPSGSRSRPDFAVVDKKGNVVKTVESKTGNATLTKNQKELQEKGGVLTGKKYEQFKGAKAKPGSIEVRRGN